MKFKVHTLVMGAGISGLSVGYGFLQNNFSDFIIIEKEKRAGGLCRSFKIGNSYYDIGAHALHQEPLEKYKLLKELFPRFQLYIQKRRAFVYIFNKLIPHPLQYHLYYLPFIKKINYLWSLLVSHKDNVNNLKQWMESKLGNYLCKIFLLPYNEKIWGMSLEKVSSAWVERIAARRWFILKGLLLKDDKNYSSNEFVCYPNRGGFENLFQLLINRNKKNICLGNRVVLIDLAKKEVWLNNKKVYQYKNLISTIPLPIFSSLVSRPHKKNLKVFTDQLKWISLCLVTFLIKKVETDSQRIYLPEKKYFAHRITINSNSSPFLKNKHETVLSMEISYLKRNLLPKRKQLINNCKKLLLDLKLINHSADIIKSNMQYFSYAYPVQTIEQEQIVTKTKGYLKYFNCYALGRFGEWDYSNIDKIILKSVSLAERLSV